MPIWQGGGWCNNVRSCVYRKKTRRGSSYYMEKQIPFSGILSNRAEENPGSFLELRTQFICTNLTFPLPWPTKKIVISFLPSYFLTWGGFSYADFFNWNRVKVRYCDGASFAGDSENKVGFSMLQHFVY